MKILGTICARGGSKGVPRKNIKLLDGIPLIHHTARMAFTNEFDKVVISTDDEEISNLFRWDEVQLRPAALATDTASLGCIQVHSRM